MRLKTAWWTSRSIIAVAVTSSPKISPQAVQLPEGVGFQKARRLVRDALADDGVAGEVASLVTELLAPLPVPV